MAKDKENQNLFQKLTKLFRSGPVVRRKIKNLDTTIAAADKTKSSGALLFQKSSSPTYASITANAYNLSERLMRYQDFGEMEYTPELAAALDIYADETCITKDSIISTPYGDFTVEKLLEYQLEQSTFGKVDSSDVWKFPVYCYDQKNKCITIGWAHSVRQTKKHAQIVEVKFDNGKSLKSTPDHRFMTRSGQWVEASCLKPGTALMPFKTETLGNSRGPGYPYIYTMNRDRTKSGWQSQHKFNVEKLVRDILPTEIVHHKDFNRSNYSPDNLVIMNKLEHQQFHSRVNNKNKLNVPNVKHSTWMLKNNPMSIIPPKWEDLLSLRPLGLFSAAKKLNVNYKVVLSWVHKRGYENWSSFCKDENAKYTELKTCFLCVSDITVDLIKSAYEPGITKSKLSKKIGCSINVLDKFFGRKLKKNWTEFVKEIGGKPMSPGGRPKGSRLYSNIEYQDICNSVKPGTYSTKEEISKKFGVSSSVIELRIKDEGYSTFSEWQEQYHNCKVISVEAVENEDVYDLTTDEHHNFACNGVIIHNCAQDDKGRVLHVYSDNEKIREILEDLFYNTLNVEFNLRAWARNLVKYGDLFLYNDVSPTHGIINAFPIPVNEIEREENYDPNDPMAVRFRWVTLGNRTLENWEISHFRLLGNDMFLPYGSSIIEPARRIWRQLILIEDAMLVYRVVRAPERRVFYIDVANIPPENVPMYVEEQRKNLRSNQVVDKQTGRVDLRYNPLCISLKTLIKLQDGRSLALEDLIKERDSGKHDQWAYSVDPEGRNLVPGKIVWAGITRKDAELVRVHIDNGTYFDCTPDHRFMLRDGTYKRADELVECESLMPLYTKLSSKEEKDSIIGYEKIYNPFTETYVYTHRSNANAALHEEKENTHTSVNWGKNNNLVIHHINFNRRNNNPSNLKWMGNSDHYNFHASSGRENIIRWNKSEKKKKRVSECNIARNSVAMMSSYNGSDLHKSHNSIRSCAMSELWNDIERRDAAKKNMRHVMTDEMFDCIVETVKQNPKWGRSKVHNSLMKNDKFISGLNSQNGNNRKIEKYSHVSWEGELVRRGYDKLSGLRKSIVGYTNHKVVRVEILEHKEDTGCITVEKYHNFAAGPSSLNPDDDKLLNSFIYLHNSVDEDYFIPVRGGESGTKIDTLAGGQNTAAVEDVAYIQKKLFAALKIPRAYLGYDEALSSKATLAQEDIRFSRTINVIQKTMISELNKLAIIHLYAHGFDSEDLQNFTLRLSNPSTVAQQQKLELWRSKFEIAGSAPEGQMSKEFIRKEIWGLNDEQSKAIDDQRLKEKIVDQLIEAAKPDEEEAAPAGGDEPPAEEPAAGGEEDAGDDAAAGGEEPAPDAGGGDLFSGDDILKKQPFMRMLTASDDPRDNDFSVKINFDDDAADEDFSVKIKTGSDPTRVPVKAQKQLNRVAKNNYDSSRRKHGGSREATNMPNLKGMTDYDSKSYSDPYDSDWSRAYIRNPLGEANRQHKTFMNNDIMSSLKNLSMSPKFKELKIHQKAEVSNVISEDTREIIDEADAKEFKDVYFIDEDGSDDI